LGRYIAVTPWKLTDFDEELSLSLTLPEVKIKSATKIFLSPAAWSIPECILSDIATDIYIDIEIYTDVVSCYCVFYVLIRLCFSVYSYPMYLCSTIASNSDDRYKQEAKLSLG